MTKTILAITIAACCSVTLVAQQAAGVSAQIQVTGNGNGDQAYAAGFMAGWMAAGRVVGKPYSATEVTRSVQTLASGGHINKTTTQLFWQDAEGRTRMETTDDRHRVMIADPIAQLHYNIDMDAMTARKTVVRMAGDSAGKPAGDVSLFASTREAMKDRPHLLVEDLGTQFMNGVSVQGVRVTTTIPVGSIGNDQELKSVTERWYSNDIHALVKTVTSDPRSGTYTYELTNIVRVAPDPALFQVPAGVTMVRPQPFSISVKKNQ